MKSFWGKKSCTRVLDLALKCHWPLTGPTELSGEKELVAGSLGLCGVPTQTQGWEGLAMQIPAEFVCGSAFGNWRPWGQGEGLEEDGPLGAPLSLQGGG